MCVDLLIPVMQILNFAVVVGHVTSTARPQKNEAYGHICQPPCFSLIVLQSNDAVVLQLWPTAIIPSKIRFDLISIGDI